MEGSMFRQKKEEIERDVVNTISFSMVNKGMLKKQVSVLLEMWVVKKSFKT
jgi:hypothetical protein